MKKKTNRPKDKMICLRVTTEMDATIRAIAKNSGHTRADAYRGFILMGLHSNRGSNKK